MDTFNKSRQSARNSLRAYLAAYGVALEEALGELEAISPSEAAEKGAVIRDKFEHEPSVPREATRYGKGNPAPWMRSPNEKPIRARHARRG